MLLSEEEDKNIQPEELEYHDYISLSPTNKVATNRAKAKCFKIYKISFIIKWFCNLFNSDSLVREFSISLFSGLIAALTTVKCASDQWHTTNYLEQLTQYKESIIQLVVFDEKGQGSKQLSKNPEKLDALRALTSDALRKLDQTKYKRELVVFLQRVNLLGIKRQKDVPGMLSEANLKDAQLGGLRLNSVDLSLSDLSKANLKDAELIKTLLNGTILKGGKLMKAKLTNADLSFSLPIDLNEDDDKICKERLEEKFNTKLGSKPENWDSLFSNKSNNSDKSIVQLRGSQINVSLISIPKECIIKRTNLRDAKLANADMKNAELIGTDLRGTDLTGVNLEEIETFEGSIYDNDTKFSKNPENDQFWKQSLMKEKKAYMIHEGAELKNVNLRYVDLSDADLSDADLRGADLRGADLRGAILRGADLSGADLSIAQLLDCDRGRFYGLDAMSTLMLSIILEQNPEEAVAHIVQTNDVAEEQVRFFVGWMSGSVTNKIITCVGLNEV